MDMNARRNKKRKTALKLKSVSVGAALLLVLHLTPSYAQEDMIVDPEGFPEAGDVNEIDSAFDFPEGMEEEPMPEMAEDEFIEVPELGAQQGDSDESMEQVLQAFEEEPPAESVEPAEETDVSEVEAVDDSEAERAESKPEEMTDSDDSEDVAMPAFDEDYSREEELFFDALDLQPNNTEMADDSIPVDVSPEQEPASKLIVVETKVKAGERKAELIAAARAVKLGRYESALEIYDSLYEKNKRNPEVLMGRAVAYQKLGYDDLAIQAYESVLSVAPKNVDAKLNMLGIIGQRYPAVALQKLKDLQGENVHNVGVVAQMAVAQANLGKYRDAIKSLGIAASIEPNNPIHIYNMAVVADMAGGRKEAIRYYEQALNVDTLYGKETLPRDAIFERLADLR